jgi:hypothetical protein
MDSPDLTHSSGFLSKESPWADSFVRISVEEITRSDSLVRISVERVTRV